HTSTKHATWNSIQRGVHVPLKRLAPMLRTKEPAGRRAAPMGFPESLVHGVGVAIQAGRGNLNAVMPWIERVVRPFYFGVFHYTPPIADALGCQRLKAFICIRTRPSHPAA